MWSRRGEENCRFPLLGVNIGLAVVAYRHGCVCWFVCVCEALLFTNFDKFLFRIISCAQAVHTRTNTHTHTTKHTTALRDTWQTASLRVYPPQCKHSLLELISSCCCCFLCCCARAMSPCVDKKEKKARNENTKNRKKTAFFVHHLSAQWLSVPVCSCCRHNLLTLEDQHQQVQRVFP